MKNFLLTLMFIYSLLPSMAQLRLSELYIKPVEGDSSTEFFELTVDPTDTIPVITDQYAVFSYFDNGPEKGFYVFDLPARKVAPGAFLLVASAHTPFNYQGITCETPKDKAMVYNWNDTSVVNASFRKFVFNGAWNVAPSHNNCNNAFSSAAVTDTVKELTVLLFKKNGSTMQLVDGIIASNLEDRFVAQPYITNLPSLNLDMQVGAETSAVTVNFSAAKNFELFSVPAASDTDDGYYFCSSWDRAANGQKLTPHEPNTSLQGEPLFARMECKPTGDTVKVTVVKGQVSPYPILASLYNDIDNDNQLDVNKGDIKMDEVIIRNKGKEYIMLKKGSPKNLIVVLDAEAKCFDDIATKDCTLPVSLTGFSAERNGNNVRLTWQTASESNNMGFYIQRRSGSNEAWDAITFIGSKAAEGNSNRALAYTFTDANPAKGITQYRLLQVDKDGRSAYSPVRSIKGLDQAATVIVFPNPSDNGVVNVLFEDASALRNVRVTDMAGRIIKEWKGITSNSMQVNNLVQGLYNISILNIKTGRQTVERFVMTR